MSETITRNLKLEFPKDLVKEPVISNVIKKFDIEANIRRADVDKDGGWLILGLSGEAQTLDEAESYIKEKGVMITPASMEMN